MMAMGGGDAGNVVYRTSKYDVASPAVHSALSACAVA